MLKQYALNNFSVYLVDLGDVKYGLDPIRFHQLPEPMSLVPIQTFRCYPNNFTAKTVKISV